MTDGAVITGVLRPHDPFTGRSMKRFGLGERIALSFSVSPPDSRVPAMRWYLQGDGTLTGAAANNGTGEYTAGHTPGDVTLSLKRLNPDGTVGATVDTKTITVVAPTDARLDYDAAPGIWHVANTYSIGFKGWIYLLPADVSFENVTFTEGNGLGVGNGYLASKTGKPHTPGPNPPASVAGGSSKGSQVLLPDTVWGGPGGMPFSEGDFRWDIPWLFGLRIPGEPEISATTQFTTATHKETADGSGGATISKKTPSGLGAGPFFRPSGAPNSGGWQPPPARGGRSDTQRGPH